MLMVVEHDQQDLFFGARDARIASPEAPRPAARRRWRSIWISDVHLGTRRARADRLLPFLQENECENLYLVGDIVDGWSIKKSWYWNDEHNRILQEILAKSSRGTRVNYISGNHDEFLRSYPGLMLGGISVKDEAVHQTADGRRLLVFHGDRFDACIRNARWLTVLGDHAYAICRAANGALNAVRQAFGRRPWSLAEWLRERVKSATSYVDTFEHAVVEEARRRGFDGVVCGHVHHAALRRVGGILYANDGDWVDSCTALVEDPTGKLALMGIPAPNGVAVPRVALA